MTLFFDPPRWPRHGKLWGHLISDSAVDELHAAARALGIPPRGFDRDHYDVPAELRDSLLALGAVEVTNADLIKILRASGLRVTAKQRRESS
ncbi:DUF4031 domain-containing protein [Micrococcales bacterium 31B]|nr:DUF4031 domain-containing protein [Micrococcales bacterium 31B]